MRVTNWPLVLANELERATAIPFCWGTWDCFQFAAEVVSALTGTDYRSSFPHYSTEAEAAAIIDAQGGVAQLIEGVLGPSKHPAFAKRGDLVMADFGRGQQPAICLGALCAAPGLTRLQFRPMTLATHAWAV